MLNIIVQKMVFWHINTEMSIAQKVFNKDNYLRKIVSIKMKPETDYLRDIFVHLNRHD